MQQEKEAGEQIAENQSSVPQRLKKPRILVAGSIVFLLATSIGTWWPTGDNGTSTIELPLPDKPSIAVVKFDNPSNDTGQAYFVDGLVEDLITDLSINRELFVSSSASSFTYDVQSMGTLKIGRGLGVAYIVRGSVRHAARRVRVSAELVDAQTGHTVWSERFDRDLTDIFTLQDKISQSIAGRLTPKSQRHALMKSETSLPVTLMPGISTFGQKPRNRSLPPRTK